ncbi:MAG TPA: STAS domain-containing protein [Chitinophagaceae bacterium]|jgi:anti-anti-sigma factor|nr:STAS domain-containing protein [Chitinophagaceae bacterium]HRG93044.1 STAS domain-containing protein [Chitinophagaceae bacterium]
MNVKSDTKEKFHVVTLSEPVLSASMTGEMEKYLLSYLQNDAQKAGTKVKNLVLRMNEVGSVEPVAAEKLVEIQQQFYESGASFVICELQQAVEDFLDQQELLELMNVTPTESEAWDIVQMEEMEREMFGDEDAANENPV